MPLLARQHVPASHDLFRPIGYTSVKCCASLYAVAPVAGRNKPGAWTRTTDTAHGVAVPEPPVPHLVAVLQDLAEPRRQLDRLEHSVVKLLRAGGATWEQIGEELGISRQHARRRYGELQKRQSPK